ncbi:MAG: type I restriction endonuclease subunit R [Gammaproteobacteria bacterium]|nr:type I restriction endonuclease subunit R [Gammaproteobacteria bacterium]
MNTLNESTLEMACIEWFQEIGYSHVKREDTISTEIKDGYREILFLSTLKNKLVDINPQVPLETIEEVIVKLGGTPSINLSKNNQLFHKAFTNGINVTYDKDGSAVDDIVNLVDFKNPENNDFAIVNQFTVIIGDENKRPDLVILINGLPIGVCELKNMFEENATLLDAYHQLQTYKNKIPDLFVFNEFLVISDGTNARAGSLTADFERFAPWRTLDNQTEADTKYLELEILIKGMFAKDTVLDIIRNFVTFKETDTGASKIIAMYHQVGAVNKAIEATVKAVAEEDKRAGVIWHTQGSGKSYSMLFFASKLFKLPELNNPTVVVLTDRNDLDNQIYSNFSTSPDILGGVERASSIGDLEKMLRRKSGGIIFSTMQKFREEEYSKDGFTTINPRENIIVIADEAHRTQYGTKTGYARNMRKALPNATFIGFTGTPIDLEERSTINVFGELIHTYDLNQSIKDGSTVMIYYEPRLAKIELTNIDIDEDYENITEGVEFSVRQSSKSKWAALEKVVGAEGRLQKIGKDIIEHFNYRDENLRGKAMVVAMSRRIAVDLYNMMKVLPNAPEITVVMTTSSSDRPEYDEFKRNKTEQQEIEKRFKDPNDPLKIVIVRDMWLTGFDIPCLHTMYIDKPMKGHNLMQAIARVNRVFKDKGGGIIVDYIGIVSDLKKALAFYTQGGISDNKLLDVDQLMGLLKDKLEIMREFFKGFKIIGFLKKSAIVQLNLIKAGADHILEGGDTNKKSFMKESEMLIKLFALLPYSTEIESFREERIFYEKIRELLIKNAVGVKDKSIQDTAINQLINESLSSGDVMDIFQTIGGDNPDMSILSEDFLKGIADLKFDNLQIEILRKVITEEIVKRRKFNVFKYKDFKDLLEKTIKQYHNKILTSTQIMDTLIKLAKDIMKDDELTKESDMDIEERAFYYTIIKHGENVMADEKLKVVVGQVIESIKNRLAIDWSSRENIRAGIRADVKRNLRRSGFPTSLQDDIVRDVMLQAEELWRDYIAA